jgi:hypothetical protein
MGDPSDGARVAKLDTMPEELLLADEFISDAAS